MSIIRLLPKSYNKDFQLNILSGKIILSLPGHVLFTECERPDAVSQKNLFYRQWFFEISVPAAWRKPDLGKHATRPFYHGKW
jgi:hypothetical protein